MAGRIIVPHWYLVEFQALGVFQSTAMIAEKAEEEGGEEEEE